MSVRLVATELPDVHLVAYQRHPDARGSFEELWNAPAYRRLGLPTAFAQDNLSRSNRGVLRGLHFQQPSPQGKLVTVLRGTIFDVAVDIRRGSPHFGRFASVTLRADTGRQLWVPPGFAHGFCVLSEVADVLYKVTTPWEPGADRAIAWDDPDLAIPWPVEVPVLSERDAAAPRLRDAPVLPP